MRASLWPGNILACAIRCLVTRRVFPYAEAMEISVPPDLETLINKRLASGGYASVEEVLRRALEAQDVEESWTDEERRGTGRAHRGRLPPG